MSARIRMAAVIAALVTSLGLVSLGEAQIRESRKQPPATTARIPQPAPQRRSASPSARAPFVEPEMVRILGGSFVMGSPPSSDAAVLKKGDAISENPQRTVSVRTFEAGRYEVTFAQWDACVADGGCGGYRPADRGWGRDRQPVINVSWHDAQAYVEWLSRRTGRNYRLLTEAEWEYAARAGTTTAYSWGADPNGGCSYGNGADISAKREGIYGTTSTCDDGVGPRTAPVGRYNANGFGLYDVHGNVVEWVEDCYHATYAGAPLDGAAWTDGQCQYRIQRGGAWLDPPNGLRSASRHIGAPTDRRGFNGFRVARTH